MSSRLASTSSGHNTRISLYNFLDFSFVSASSAAGQRVVGARGGRLDLQHAGAVDRARRHRFSGRDLDRDRFTGDRRSVQARPARADQPIGRDPLARADQ